MREGGDNGLFIMFITVVPKVFYLRFIIRWELLLNFDWLVQLFKCLNDSTTNCDLQKG